MEHAASTPKKAIEKMKRFHAIDPDFISGFLSGGVYYVKENQIAHPLRKYGACYIKGNDQQLVASRCDTVDGVLILKPEWNY